MQQAEGQELVAKAKRNNVFEFQGETILPGERKAFELEAAKLYTHSPLSIPVEVINGRFSGPVLMVNAAIHGDELNGVEIVRQLINTIDATKLKGTLIAVPIVNVFGFIHKSRYLPDRRDLNRCFPGSNKGSLASRMAHTFYSQVAERCDYIIDLHTGAIHRTNLPQIRADLSNPETMRIAKAFATPVIVDAPLRNGSLRSEAELQGIPVLTYEAGEALRFEPICINAGFIGIQRVMQTIGMLRASRKKLPTPVIAKSTSWLRAESDGILRTLVTLGERVERGQILAYISAPLGHDEIVLKANKGGVVIGQQTLPLVNEGDAIFHLAYFTEDDEEVEQAVGEFIGEVVELDAEPLTTGQMTPPNSAS
ncbi:MULTISPECIES: succinylglutamate desuccinylase/aspartoacylase family protein [unclassified Vibrio]|uniref:succinylglutamate desuccinylase/aspartoacylase family protein n=1 Tax=unclassified Vibrio TaxID=2614977 RepID=UPI001361A57B|nr:MULTISPECIES: succinylglutamate desuccinylase/aspartoacylase family protein [unclassified Vibrio]NAW56947.1 deacylase [Vibrio sp. V36_P2S2PM302]NAX22778.1 deacylase [Vibrio sp. V39_P1S14PM300]NAX27536.1 deacylase [Vibrio sp. V38_P2S17PM301]NAX28493.1 deacylase [Vibrio sp. V37_P2S8PM304]